MEENKNVRKQKSIIFIWIQRDDRDALRAQINKDSQIGFVLIHDGVIGINKKGKIPKKMEELFNMNITIYAMIPDLQARGIALENIHDKVKPIEYDDLIDILDVTPKIISWM